MSCMGASSTATSTPLQSLPHSHSLNRALYATSLSHRSHSTPTPQDYDALKNVGVAAIYGPGTRIPAAAAEMMTIINARLPDQA